VRLSWCVVCAQIPPSRFAGCLLLTLPSVVTCLFLISPAQGTFRALLAKRGQLVLALGGKSVGKSFILRTLAKEIQAEGRRRFGSAM